MFHRAPTAHAAFRCVEADDQPAARSKLWHPLPVIALVVAAALVAGPAADTPPRTLDRIVDVVALPPQPVIAAVLDDFGAAVVVGSAAALGAGVVGGAALIASLVNVPGDVDGVDAQRALVGVSVVVVVSALAGGAVGASVASAAVDRDPAASVALATAGLAVGAVPAGVSVGDYVKRPPPRAADLANSGEGGCTPWYSVCATSTCFVFPVVVAGAGLGAGFGAILAEVDPPAPVTPLPTPPPLDPPTANPQATPKNPLEPPDVLGLPGPSVLP